MTKISRRAWLALSGAGAASAASIAALELASLRGRFDNRRLSAQPRSELWQQTLGELARPELAQGAFVHVGHSTHLICLGNKRILTDPWFYDPAFGALSHAAGPAARPAELGPLDAVVITHDHPDHADRRAIAELPAQAQLIVGQAELASALERMGRKRVTLLELWQSVDLDGVRITALPALHDVPEVGFLLELGERRVYFAGDTALCDGLHEIAARYAPTLAILPIDGTRRVDEPRLVMNPEDALSASRLLGARYVVPSHAEAQFSDPFARRFLLDTVEHPLATFRSLLANELPRCALWQPQPGRPIPIPNG